MPEPRVIVKALIRLNRLENESKHLGDRSKRKVELLSLIGSEQAKIPGPILAHHQRLRARGRDSTAPVRDWVCRACFITVASGMRTHLMQRDDLHVCQNCGSYSYVADGTEDYPDDTQLLTVSKLLLARSEKKKKPAIVAQRKVKRVLISQKGKTAQAVAKPRKKSGSTASRKK